MLGNVTFGNAFTTNDSYAITLDATGTTTLTLPATGTLISKDDSGNATNIFNDYSITGTMTGDVDRSANTSVVAGTYGSATILPVITIDSSGFVDSVGSTTMDAALLDGQQPSHYRIDVYDASGTLLN